MCSDDDGDWNLEYWEDASGRSPFKKWYERLGAYDQMVVDTVFQEVAKPLGINICNTQWASRSKEASTKSEFATRRPRCMSPTMQTAVALYPKAIRTKASYCVYFALFTKTESSFFFRDTTKVRTPLQNARNKNQNLQSLTQFRLIEAQSIVVMPVTSPSLTGH